MGRILLLVFLALFLVLATLRKWKLFFAVTVAALAAALVLLFTTVRPPEMDTETPLERVRLGYGPDKRPLVTATVFEEALKSVHGLIVSGTRLPADPEPGSIPPLDACWADGYRLLDRLESAGNPPLRTAMDFGAHLVVATWPEVARALERRDLVQSDGPNLAGGVLTNPAGLLDLMDAETPWTALGIRDMPGTVRLVAPAPGGGATGRLAAQWLHDVSMGKAGAGAELEAASLAGLRARYERMGPLEPSAMALFSQFVKQGAWDYPLVVVDEQVVAAFEQAFPAYRETLTTGIRILRLPEPRLVVHPAISFTPAGNRFLEALAHPETAGLIWERHGLRPLNGKNVPIPERVRRFGLDRLPPAEPARPDTELLSGLAELFPNP
jgi:hypothetical protein